MAFWLQNASKTVFGWGSTLDPIGGAYDTPTDPLVRWGGDTPPHTPPPRRLRRLDLGASVLALSLLNSFRRH